MELQSYASYKNINCGGLIYWLTSCFESALNKEMLCYCFFKAVLFFFQKCFHKTPSSWLYTSPLVLVFLLGICWLLGEIRVSEMHCSCGMQRCAQQQSNGQLFVVKDVGREGQSEKVQEAFYTEINIIKFAGF